MEKKFITIHEYMKRRQGKYTDEEIEEYYKSPEYEEIRAYSISPEYRKIYYEKHKERIAEKSKAYREENKEVLKQKIRCPVCCSEVRKYGLKEHQKTKKCLKIKNNA